MATAETVTNIMQVLSQYLLSAGATIRAGLTLEDLKALFTKDGISTALRENAYQQIVRRIGYEGVGQMVSELWVYLDEEEQNFYRAKGLGVIGTASAESVLGSVANSLGLTLAPTLPQDKMLEALRNAGVAPGAKELISVVNEGTEVAPVYKTAVPRETIQRYFQAMWEAGFFNSGEVQYIIPPVGNYSVTNLAPITKDFLKDVYSKMYRGGSTQWLNDGVFEAMATYAPLSALFSMYNYVLIKKISASSSAVQLEYTFLNIALPISGNVDYSSQRFARLRNATNRGEGYRISTRWYAGDVTTMYQGALTNQLIGDVFIGVNDFSLNSVAGEVASNANAVSLPGIEGVIIQDGATIPASALADLAQTYPAWASTWKKYSTLTEEGVITDADIVPLVIDPTDAWEKDRAQAGAQAGVIDVAVEGVLEDIVTDVIVPALDVPKTEVFNPAIAIDVPLEVVIPGGVTPPIIIPGDNGSAGLYTVYNPSRSQLDSISSFLWQTSILSQIQQMFQSAYDAVISLHEIYVTPDTSGSEYIHYGGLVFSQDTTTGTVPIVSNRYKSFAYPAVRVPGLYANSLDYSPYVTVSLYLPFIGIVQLNTNDVIDGELEVRYIVDVVTGTAVAQVSITKYGDKQLLYTFEGNCSMQMPVTGREHVLKSELALVGTMVAGASALSGGGALAGLTAVQGLTSAGGVQLVHKGNTSANAGAVSPRLPYLIVNHSESAVADGYYNIEGGSASETIKLGECKGYTKVRAVHLDGIACTTTEKQEIEALLMGGVIL